MSNLILRLTRTPPFAKEADAVRVLSALAGVLSSFSLRGGLWTVLSGARLDLSAGTFEHGLLTALGIRADVPEQPTHLFPVCFAAQGPTEIGTLSISIRDPAPPASFPGLSAVLELPEHTFQTGPAELKVMLERCVDVVDADAAMIGPRRWIRKEQAAWCVYARGVDRDLLPAGSDVLPVRSGLLIVAHATDPASESDSALRAALRMRDAVRAAAGVRAVPAPPPNVPVGLPLSLPASGSGGAPSAAGSPRVLPSFMASPKPATPAARDLPTALPQRQSGLTEDVDVSAILRGLRGLQPDARGASAAVPPAPTEPPKAAAVRPPPPDPPSAATPPARDYTETAEVDVGALARAVLAFGPPKETRQGVAIDSSSPRPPGRPAEPPRASSGGPSPVSPQAQAPGLTLQQYASLTVDIELNPAQTADILRRYGAHEEGKRALDEQWAQVLGDQPARRAAFEEAKAYYRAWLSGRSSKT